MSLALGARLGRYEIRSQIGSGGMGEVYLAWDSELDRTVALKILPPEVASDPERMRRFVQEAKSASALNHPNILIVHDVGRSDSIPFMVTEHVEGDTLRARLRHGRLSLIEALDVAIQIASALAEAHHAGLIHRDVKPENVMLRRGGLVKLLDFGLAKAADPDAVDGDAPTAALLQTAEGLVLGTAAYMSPEQAEGKPVDARSDIFSFGAVLYEMLTGRRAFQGENTLSTLSAILRDDPQPIGQLVDEIPRDAEKLIARCLRKDLRRRCQHMDDLKVALEELKEELESGTVQTNVMPTGARGARPSMSIVVAGGLALGIAGTVWWNFFRPASPMPSLTPLTSLPGIEQQPAVSPDGQQIAFSWNGAQGDNFDIYIQHIAGGAPLRLTTNVADDISPVWSPDGGRIAFVRQAPSGGAVIVVPSLGGPERRLIDVALHAGMDRILDWSPDGKLLAIADRTTTKECEISLLSVEGGDKRILASPPAGAICDNSPAFSPDGRSVVFVRWAGQAVGDLYEIPTVGGEAKRLTFDNRQNRGPVWMPDGQSIVFSSERDGGQALWKIAATGGTPEKLMDARGSIIIPGVSRQKNSQNPRLALEETVLDSNIWRVEASHSSGARSLPKRFIASTRQDVWPQYSPDGMKVAFASDRSGSWEIWVSDGDGANAAQLTSFRGRHVGSPVWSPDSRRIAFDARPEGSPDIYSVNAEGGLPRRLTTDSSEDTAPSWSNNGRWIYFASDRDGTQQVWKMPADGGQPRRVTKGGGFASRESPDGKVLYFTKRRWAPGGLWRMPVDGGEETPFLDQLEPEYDRMWALTGEGVYFIQHDRPPRAVISLLSVSTRRATSLTAVDDTTHYAPGLSVSPDGRWILYTQIDQRNADILLLEHIR
jgi:eukaryotic-like serine/threonine-protein kinase